MRALSRVELLYPYAVMTAFVVQGLARGRIGTAGSGVWGTLVWSVASLVLIVLLFLQRRNPMLAVVAVGIASNVSVVLLNGHMPVSLGPTSDVATLTGFYAVATSGTIAPLMGDCLPLPLFAHTYMFSVGDVLLVAGVAAFIVSGMCPGMASVAPGDVASSASMDD